MVNVKVVEYRKDDVEVIVDGVVVDVDEIEEIVQNAIRNKEMIELDYITRPLGRKYGNSYWWDITFEHLDGEWWEATIGRGSNTWAVWRDIGMTGVKTDSTIYVDTEDVEEFVEKFMRIDVWEWIDEMRGKADYSLYVRDWNAINEFIDLLREYDSAWQDVMAVVEIWNEEEFKQKLVNILYEIDDEIRKKFIDFLEELRDEYDLVEDEEQFNIVEKEIKNAKDIGDIVSAFERIFAY